MADVATTFYRYSQEEALSRFPPLLKSYLPQSNPIYNRIRAPHNLPSRHCLFAANFPPDHSPNSDGFTIVFADRSRHFESQIWVFNSLLENSVISEAQQALISKDLQALIHFLKDVQIPDAPGWPFSPTLKFACLHKYLSDSLVEIGKSRDALPYSTTWNLWNISTSSIPSRLERKRSLPPGYRVTRVPEDQIDLVISTSSIPRQASTLLAQPSIGLLNETGDLVAWGYIGVDGSFATLYVIPEYRGKGLATSVALELLGRLAAGEFTDLGFDGSSGWAHSDVYAGNKASESVMKVLGGRIGWTTKYMWIESDKF